MNERRDSKYPELTKLIKAMLTLSPGSADVERGFSRSCRILGEDRHYCLNTFWMRDSWYMSLWDFMEENQNGLLLQKKCCILHVLHGLNINNICMKRKKKSYPRRRKELLKRTTSGSCRRSTTKKKRNRRPGKRKEKLEHQRKENSSRYSTSRSDR